MTLTEEITKYRLICEDNTDFVNKPDIQQPSNSKWTLEKTGNGKMHPNSWYVFYYNETDPEYRLTTIYDRLTDSVHILTYIKMGQRKDYKFDSNIDADKFLRNKFGISLDKGKGYIK